jgi:hypothetical protein
MAYLAAAPLRSSEALFERFHGFLDFRFDAVVERFFLGNALQDSRMAGFHKLQKLFFKAGGRPAPEYCQGSRWWR